MELKMFGCHNSVEGTLDLVLHADGGTESHRDFMQGVCDELGFQPSMPWVELRNATLDIDSGETPILRVPRRPEIVGTVAQSTSWQVVRDDEWSALDPRVHTYNGTLFRILAFLDPINPDWPNLAHREDMHGQGYLAARVRAPRP